MSTKLLLKLAAWSSIPLFLCLVIMCMVAVQVYGGSAEQAMRFYSGQMSTGVIMVAGIVGSLLAAFVFSAIMVMMRYADRIDKLEKAATYHREAKERYDRATAEFVSKMKNN